MSGRLWLFVSLAVNLLLVGLIVGANLGEVRQQRDRAAMAVGRMPNMRVVLDALPPERADDVRTKVVDTWRQAKEERRGARQARIELMKTVGAQTYDANAVRAGFARVRDADARVAARFHDVVTDAMQEMTPAERREMLRRLAQRRADIRRLRPGAEAEELGPAPRP